MYPTPRFLARSSLAVVLVVLAVVIEDPLLLVGAATVGGWIVARQLAFACELEETVDALAVRRDLEQTTVRTDESSTITLAVTLSEPSALQLSIDGTLPTAATAESGTATSVTLESDETNATDSRTVRWPVSGRHELGSVTVTATDGSLRKTISVGNRRTVRVEPRGDEPVHVGSGGDRIATAYGEHEGGRLGSGDDPAEPREYVPGDTADKIDWKATARLGTTYVREFETEADRRTTLVVDHRSTLAAGPSAGTKFDHLREVALSMAERAYRAGDPVGLVTVDEAGISTRIGHTTAGGTYRTIRQRLLDLDPDTAVSGDPEPRLTGDEARTRLASLASTGSHTDDPFETTLRPFYEERASGTDRVNVDSLTDGVRAAIGSQQQRCRTVIFTDDSRADELRETVGIVRNRGNDVLVLLTPSVLYETRRVTALEQSFDRYVAFEELRRDLARMDEVTALEVGPGDRLATIVDAGQTRGDAA